MSYFDLPRITGADFLARRTGLKLRQVDIAKKMGVTTRTVMRWEKTGAERISCKWWVLQKVSKVLAELESVSHVTSTSRQMSRDTARPRINGTSKKRKGKFR